MADDDRYEFLKWLVCWQDYVLGLTDNFFRKKDKNT